MLALRTASAPSQCTELRHCDCSVKVRVSLPAGRSRDRIYPVLAESASRIDDAAQVALALVDNVTILSTQVSHNAEIVVKSRSKRIVLSGRNITRLGWMCI